MHWAISDYRGFYSFSTEYISCSGFFFYLFFSLHIYCANRVACWIRPKEHQKKIESEVRNLFFSLSLCIFFYFSLTFFKIRFLLSTLFFRLYWSLVNMFFMVNLGYCSQSYYALINHFEKKKTSWKWWTRVWFRSVHILAIFFLFFNTMF